MFWLPSIIPILRLECIKRYASRFVIAYVCRKFLLKRYSSYCIMTVVTRIATIVADNPAALRNHRNSYFIMVFQNAVAT